MLLSLATADQNENFFPPYNLSLIFYPNYVQFKKNNIFKILLIKDSVLSMEALSQMTSLLLNYFANNIAPR